LDGLNVTTLKGIARREGISGYSKYRADTVDDLRQLIRDTRAGTVAPEVADSSSAEDSTQAPVAAEDETDEEEQPQVSAQDDLDGLNVTTLKGIARREGISGYSKYRADTVDDLRQLIRDTRAGAVAPEVADSSDEESTQEEVQEISDDEEQSDGEEEQFSANDNVMITRNGKYKGRRGKIQSVTATGFQVKIGNNRVFAKSDDLQKISAAASAAPVDVPAVESSSSEEEDVSVAASSSSDDEESDDFSVNDNVMITRNGKYKGRRGKIQSVTATGFQVKIGNNRVFAKAGDLQKTGDDSLNRIQSAFDNYDADNDGEISIDELKRGYSESGLAESDALNALTEYDLDGDGQINFEEFKDWCLKTDALSHWEDIKSRNFDTGSFTLEQCTLAAQGFGRDEGGLDMEDIIGILRINNEDTTPNYAIREILRKALETRGIASDSRLLESSDEDEEPPPLGGMATASDLAAADEEDEELHSDSGEDEYSLAALASDWRSTPAPGELTHMLANMSDDWASSDDELNFAEESSHEMVKTSSGLEFAESSAAETDSDNGEMASKTGSSDVEFAESSAVESGGESIGQKTSSGLEFVESSAMETDSDADNSANLKSSDLDFAESSAIESDSSKEVSTSSGLVWAESSDYD